MRNQRIAERGVRKELAGGDLVVSDDPIAEVDVPPDIRIAQGIEADSAGEDQDSREQRSAQVRDPGEQTAAWFGRLRR